MIFTIENETFLLYFIQKVQLLPNGQVSEGWVVREFYLEKNEKVQCNKH